MLAHWLVFAGIMIGSEGIGGLIKWVKAGLAAYKPAQISKML
jgi:hypothetical protein